MVGHGSLKNRTGLGLYYRYYKSNVIHFTCRFSGTKRNLYKAHKPFLVRIHVIQLLNAVLQRSITVEGAISLRGLALAFQRLFQSLPDTLSLVVKRPEMVSFLTLHQRSMMSHSTRFFKIVNPNFRKSGSIYLCKSHPGVQENPTKFQSAKERNL